MNYDRGWGVEVQPQYEKVAVCSNETGGLELRKQRQAAGLCPTDNVETGAGSACKKVDETLFFSYYRPAVGEQGAS